MAQEEPFTGTISTEESEEVAEVLELPPFLSGFKSNPTFDNLLLSFRSGNGTVELPYRILYMLEVSDPRVVQNYSMLAMYNSDPTYLGLNTDTVSLDKYGKLENANKDSSENTLFDILSPIIDDEIDKGVFPKPSKV